MRIHHLNCGTMQPVAGRLLRSERQPTAHKPFLVCHVLLIETEDGLVLVDSGMGLADIAAAKQRLGGPFLSVVRPVLDDAETARRQIERLGLDPDDVRHIVLTHLDLDHAGGIADFPRARVHVLAAEHAAAHAAKSLHERARYNDAQWVHGPEWVLCRPDGERWFGFEAARELDGLPPEILMIPLTGHTRGRAGVAVDTGDGWLLHTGDAYFHADEMQISGHSCPLGLRVFQQMVAENNRQRRRNQQRLRELKAGHAAEIDILCAHDPEEWQGRMP